MRIVSAFEGTVQFKARVGLLFYSDRANPHADEDLLAKNTLITRHPVTVDAEGRATFEAGRPVGADELRDMMQALMERQGQGHRRLIDHRLLYADNTRLLWWSPQKRRTVWFSTADKKFNAAVNGKEALHPTLLFLAKPGSLYIFALVQNERPTEQTPVFTGPYCNLYSDGHMCRGSVKLPQSMEPEQIDAWESAYFDSAFTHSNLSGQATSFPGGHHALWRELVKKKWGPLRNSTRGEEFPAKYLLPLSISVAAPASNTPAPGTPTGKRAKTVADVLDQ